MSDTTKNNIIIDFNAYKNKKVDKITEEDVLNLLLIFKYEEIVFININELMKSLGKYQGFEKYRILYDNLTIVLDDNDQLIIDLNSAYHRGIENGLIIESSENEFMILASPEQINSLKEKYSKKILRVFNDLMFYINNDLKYGIDNWELIFEDELLKYPRYPSIVTGEFIDKEKDQEVMLEVKKRSIERLKRINGKK